VLFRSLLAPSLRAQAPVFRKVVLEGEPAPGMPGLAFAEIGGIPGFGTPLIAGPAIDERGDVAVPAYAGPPPLTLSSPRGFWREHAGVLELVVAGGDPAPGTQVSFGGFPLFGSTPQMQ